MSGLGGFGGWRPALREARTGWPVLVVLAVVSAVLAVVSLLWPPVFDGLSTKELNRRLAAAQVDGLLVTARATVHAPRNFYGQSTAPQFGSLDSDLTRVGEGMRQGSSGELAHTLVRVSGWAQSDGMDLSGAGVARPHGRAASVSLAYAQDAVDRVRWVAGRAPGQPDGAKQAPIELGMSRKGLAQFGLAVGQRVQLSGQTGATEAVVVGEFEPLDGADDLWRELPLLNEPLDAAVPEGYIRYGQALVAPAGLEAMEARGSLSLSATWAFGVAQQPWGNGGTAAGVRELASGAKVFKRSAVDRVCGEIVSDAAPCSAGVRTVTPPQVQERLSALVDRFAEQRARTVSLQSFALAGLLAIGVSTAVAAARLGARRREGVLALQRARGAGEPALAAVRLLEAVPAVLVGVLAGRAVSGPLAGERPLGAWWPAVAAAVLVAGAPAAAVWWQGRAVRRAGREPVQRRGVKRALGLSGRLVLEGAVLALAAMGVLQLRLRGALAPGTADPDPQLALVPVVLGLAAVVVVLRVYPVPLRVLTGWARRRRGTVALVGLSQAGRRSAAAATALLVLVPALACAVFGALVSGTVRHGRVEAAQWRTGGDAVVLGPSQRPLPLEELAKVPGVGGVLPVRGGVAALTADEDGSVVKGVGLVGVDQAALAGLEPGSPVAAALAAAGLSAPLVAGAELPALADAGTAARFPDGSFDADAGASRFRVRIVGVLPAGADRDRAIGPVVGEVGGGPLLVFGGPAAERLPRQTGQRNAAVLFAEPGRAGSPAGAQRIDGARLRSVVAASAATAGAGGAGAAGGAVLRGAPVEVRDLAGQLRESADDGLVSALELAFRSAAAIGLLLGLAAVVLELLLGSAERGRMLAYLRTLGLGARAAAGVQLVQLLPVMAAAVIGGTLLGLGLPWLLGPALDLRAFTSGPGAPAFAPDWAAIAVAALALLVLVPCAAALEGVAGRRRVPQLLRLGEGAQ
ncbi:FtsX-like permease family protein [Kitasatospora griseola]|uniref:FtsX-like permease family protein n=1 Tax=Kitasatospora griseola TaxID=2064 RepID=UPI00167015A9|nr:FtsX-like permease family protein [Kitasatospora griseola]GGQ99512.1 membrane protein [Kitasatospora griseola]